jgi:peroxisomal 2,4-dienoyl-CoA reductase
MDTTASPSDARAIFAPGLLSGRVALITGGGTGIGRAIAEAMAALGARVAIASRSPAHLDPAAAAIRERTGARVAALEVDVRDSARVDAMIERAEAELGPLDILVNNAAGNFFRPSVAMSDSAWAAVRGIDLDGTFYCSRAAARGMLERRFGRIINITATLHRRGFPGMAHMTAAKAGIDALTRTLGSEWAPYGVTVNAIAPGPVETEGAMKAFEVEGDARDRAYREVPVGRFGRAEEIACVACFLASPAGAFVTGAVWTIDGGEELGKVPRVPGLA